MNILITNIFIVKYTGSEVYVRELAIELQQRGHNVEIFTFFTGKLAEELEEKGIPVVTNLKSLKLVPDIIHAHHNITAIDAIAYFRSTPLIYFIHDRTTIFDIPYRHRNILQYVAVDYNCKERYLEHYFKGNDVEVIRNWANLDRFKLKKQINNVPKKALVFSNYISENLIYPNIKEACLALNIDLDIVGYSSGNFCLKPEDILHNYDLVFGKAKAAIEAMASGAAVVVCDFTGLGGMVTPENVKHFRDYNFGMKLMKTEPTIASLIDEIKKYNAAKISEVSNYIIRGSDFKVIIDHLEKRYTEIIADYKSKKRGKYRRELLKIWKFYQIKRRYVINPKTRIVLKE